MRPWCKGEGIDPAKALLVKDVPEDEDISFIEETLQSIKALGRVKVRGGMYDPQSQSLTVLCECREAVNAKTLPLDVLPQGSNLSWRIFGPKAEKNEPQNPAAGESPHPDLSQASPLQASTPEAIIRAVGDILQKKHKPTNNENSIYRRLRTFSGVTPTPPGEEQLENWIEQARLMIEECDRPEREKRMRVMESVKGPALEILQAVRFNNPDTTATEYLDILENTFGTPETGEELYFAFRLLCQHPSEKLSEFLRRMERVLNKVVQKGGLQPATADKARLDQLIKGATRSDLMILNLGLREHRDNPPTFLQLLNEIRLEEEHEASRHRLHPPKVVHARSVAVNTDSQMRDLKAELQELRTQFSEITAPSVMSRPSSRSSHPTANTPVESSEDRNIQALKKEVVRLRKQVSVMSVKPMCSPATVPHHNETNSKPVKQRTFTPRDPNDFFCYRCGEDGHFATNCAAPENYHKVVQKLLQAKRKPKANQKPDQAARAKVANAHVKRSAVKFHTNGLPEGLVGPSSTAQVKINGNSCTALMDSGSQVTIIFDSWYSENLSHIPLNPVTGLAIWGLSEAGNSYPYKGYVQVDLELPKESKSKKAKAISTLALVCPDPRCSDTLPVLIGTNVKGVRPLNANQKTKDSENFHAARVQVQEQNPLPAAESQSSTDNTRNSPVAEVKWAGPGPLIIPAGT